MKPYPNAKLTVAEVKRCIRAYHEDGMTLEALSQRFGVKKSTISRIVNGLTWGTHGKAITQRKRVQRILEEKKEPGEAK